MRLFSNQGVLGKGSGCGTAGRAYALRAKTSRGGHHGFDSRRVLDIFPLSFLSFWKECSAVWPTKPEFVGAKFLKKIMKSCWLGKQKTFQSRWILRSGWTQFSWEKWSLLFRRSDCFNKNNCFHRKSFNLSYAMFDLYWPLMRSVSSGNCQNLKTLSR